MNKQEAIEEIKDEIKRNGKRSGSLDYLNGKRDGLVDALKIIKQIDEPEKPVVPQFVAEWIDKHKNTEKKDRLSHALEHVFDDVELGLYIKQQEGDYTETIAKAWIYGYTVEKEKLYTARLKIITKEKESYVYKIIESGEIYLSNLVFIEGKSQVYFTQKELEELNYWNNPNFEIEEVEEK